MLSTSADPEANVADGFGAETLPQFSQDVDVGNVFEFHNEGGLKKGV